MIELYKKNGAVFIPAGITFEEVEKLKDGNKVMADNYSKMEKMKYLLNEIYSEYGFSELVKIRNNLPIEIQEVIKEIK